MHPPRRPRATQHRCYATPGSSGNAPRKSGILRYRRSFKLDANYHNQIVKDRLDAIALAITPLLLSKQRSSFLLPTAGFALSAENLSADHLSTLVPIGEPITLSLSQPPVNCLESSLRKLFFSGQVLLALLTGQLPMPSIGKSLPQKPSPHRRFLICIESPPKGRARVEQKFHRPLPASSRAGEFKPCFIGLATANT
jgi:hypothetical protein